jgi:hypothetical protein
VSEELKISYEAVGDKCGRQLTGSSEGFKEMLRNGTIYEYLLEKKIIHKTPNCDDVW